MVGDGGEVEGVVGQSDSNRGAEHGVGEWAPVTQATGSKQLGEPEGSDEGDVGDAGRADGAAAEHASCDQPGEVRRHDHGDGGKGVARLGCDDGASQRLGRGSAVARDLHRHETKTRSLL